jgi:hypothetical protein
MIELLNIIFALLTIGFGLFGWVLTEKTMSYVGLQSADHTGMGRSEVRAASGALWVAVALAALWIGTPVAYVMLGAVYLGAATGRLTAIIVDKARHAKAFTFFAVEVITGAALVVMNSAVA